MSEAPVLHHRFRPPETFRRASPIRPLPFEFMRFDQGRYVAFNLTGEHVLVPRETLVALVDGTLTPDHPDYRRLRERHFFLDGYSNVALELLAAKYRTKHSRLSELAGLHLFVTTLRCDHSCPYCQVSRASVDKQQFDMSVETADHAIRLMFESPSPALKVEFQGGESTLNWELIQHIVSGVNERNAKELVPRNVAYVIATGS